MSDPHLAFNVRLSRGDFDLAAAASLHLEGVTVFFGPSGCGKTTLLRALGGLEPNALGHIAFNGEIWQDAGQRTFRPAHQRGAGLVFQDVRLFPHLTVDGNLRYAERRRHGPGPDRDAVIGGLELAPLLARRPGRLSGGERQRVAMARALLAGPKLLMMDEPLASLDAARKAEILPLIGSLPQNFGVPIIYVSHGIDEVLQLARGLALFDNGRIVAAGRASELLGRPDLWQYTGWLDAGAVLTAEVADHDDHWGLTRLAFPGGSLYVTRQHRPEGAPIGVRIRSRDVALALKPPSDTSVLNVLPATVAEMQEDGVSHVHVGLDVGEPLWARITRRSAAELGLESGCRVYALIKAVAVDSPSTPG